MAMSPFALTILGMEAPPRRRGEHETEVPTSDALHNVPVRPSRRATSHYSYFLAGCVPASDSPPSYAIATRHKHLHSRHPNEGRETLPEYDCTVHAEARLLLQLESINPLHGVSESEWREVYVILRGTLLSIYRVKDGGAGKLLRSYTLQHAEVGLAADSQHTVLIPQTRLAHLIPTSARRKAWQKDPDLFKPVKQTILRLRIETDQILLADRSEDRIHDLIYAISAGIDISYSIDERNVPRQCTVPRRRRRQRTVLTGDLNDPALLAEQERILREMYPAFAEQQLAAAARPELQRTVTQDTTSVPLATPSREEDDLDFAIMREDFATPDRPAPTQSSETPTRPAVSRMTTASSVVSALSQDMIYATSPNNFSETGKWQPPHPRTAAQIQRYARRCMPILLAESIRASDILICHGRRVKVNWRMEMLEDWELCPPSYKAHHFKPPVEVEEIGAELQRSRSQASQSGSSASNSSPQSSRSVLERVDQIEPIDTNLTNLDLTKTATNLEKSSPVRVNGVGILPDAKIEESREAVVSHGVIFAF
jgi:hypothetical protein